MLFDLKDLFTSPQISMIMKLSSIFVCQLLIGVAFSEFDLSKWLKGLKHQREQRQPSTISDESKSATILTTPDPCNPYGSKCVTVFVSADNPSILRDYADIAGRYIHNPDEVVEWAPERPVYEKVSKDRNLIYER